MNGAGGKIPADGGSDDGLDEEIGDGLNDESDPDEAEFQPVLRSFFQSAALAVISTVAVAQLGQFWGMANGGAGPWDAAMNIVLAGVLVCLCYPAVTTLIDRRIAQEGGAPDDEEQELGGEDGGPGASRVATLLPILR
jgi:small-conductance mechanosensitive channel